MLCPGLHPYPQKHPSEAFLVDPHCRSFTSGRPLHLQVQCSPLTVLIFNERHLSTWFRLMIGTSETASTSPLQQFYIHKSLEAGSFSGFSDPSSPLHESCSNSASPTLTPVCHDRYKHWNLFSLSTSVSMGISLPKLLFLTALASGCGLFESHAMFCHKNLLYFL